MLVLSRQKLYTKWDSTDALKREKDSDILAEEEKKPVTKYREIAARAATGAAAGAIIGGLANGIRGGFSKKPGMTFGKGLKTGAALGALAGGALLSHGAIKKRNEEQEDIDFYNDRLRYAKRQALRREKADWKQNMTQRDGYSY